MSNTLSLYLGDPQLRPILVQLNSRGAIVFMHPTTPCPAQHASSPDWDQTPPSKRYALSSPLASAYRAPLFEFFFDGPRTLLDMLMTGTAVRFKSIRWIASHCCEVLPSLIDRVILFSHLEPLTITRDPIPVSEAQIREIFSKQIWYDLAGNPVPNQVDSVLKFTGKERLLFGSDMPWTPFAGAGQGVKNMERALPDCVGEEWVDKIFRGNAEQLLSKSTRPKL